MKSTITSKQACTIAHQIRRETGCSLADAFKAAYAGDNTVTPKTSWTRDELDQIFSDKTAELLRKGYLINTKDMNGHQGEIAKLLFRKNGKVYILVMESNTLFDEDFWKYNDVITIKFGVNTCPDWSTVWIDKMEVIWSMSVVKISDNYFVSEDLARQYNKISLDRHRVRYNRITVDMSSKYHKAVLPLVRKQKGYKSTKLSDIETVYRETPTNRNGNPQRRLYKVILNKKDKNGRSIVIDIRF